MHLGDFYAKVVILGPFATLWGGLGGPGAKRVPKSLILESLGLPLGSLWGSFLTKIRDFFNEKNLSKLGLIFACILIPKKVPNARQKEPTLS